MKRPTTVSPGDFLAECQDCDWSLNARNALGAAARHYDATLHSVVVTCERTVYYGRGPGEPRVIPGQTALV